ncbi:hypothetical protein FPQ18DRAFT_318326 [Pyronema domesticum]|nr:hypothetical protein FPQ18DRAFT_318326 [Pyronema domesticum]
MAMNYPRPPEIYGIAQSHSPPNTDESGSLTQGHPSKNSPDHRAAKRTKVDGKSTSTPRRRVPTACENCRLRKTKCDGAKPVCGSCARMGVECIGGDEKELSLYETTSLNILQGIERIENMLRTQMQNTPSSPPRTIRAPQPPPTTSALSPHTATVATVMSPPQVHAAVSPALSYQSTASIATAIYEPPSPIPAIHTLFDSNSTSGTQSKMLKTPSKLDRVLAWNIIPKPTPNVSLASVRNWREAPGDDIPLVFDEVKSLHALYLDRFHPAYPIINVETLEHCVNSTFEGNHGCGWDSEACLMLLVCALGAVADDYNEHFSHFCVSGSSVLSTNIPQVRAERQALAEGYWHMAHRRLGCVMSEETELAGQCLALAGFWYLYQLDPISSYKMFHSACLSWQTLHLAQGRALDIQTIEVDGVGSGMTYAQYLKQRLYWTCLKAEFELRAELSLPVPTGAQLEYPLEFPPPPTLPLLPKSDPKSGAESTINLHILRLWYLYTAEIFLRRLHNRMIDEVTAFEAYLEDPKKHLYEKRITSLITVVREFESFISSWHSSLPNEIRFPDPNTTGAIPSALPDERQQFIRKRFLDCHELLYRPFLNLILNVPNWRTYVTAHPKSRGMDINKLEAEIRQLAAMAVQYTYYSIAADRGVWFQHSATVWYDIRNRLADTLILRAAAKWGMDMPMDWEELVGDAEEGLLYWCEGREGMEERRMRSGLAGCAEVVKWAREYC